MNSFDLGDGYVIIEMLVLKDFVGKKLVVDVVIFCEVEVVFVVVKCMEWCFFGWLVFE